jgi:hypothetical protein
MKHAIHLNNIRKLSSYLTKDTLPIDYKEQVNVSGNNSCLFLQLYRTGNALKSYSPVVIYQSIRRDIPEGTDLQQLSCDSYKHPIKCFVLLSYEKMIGDEQGAKVWVLPKRFGSYTAYFLI